MRARFPAACLSMVLTAAARPGLAQTAPPAEIASPPAASSAAPIPPPVELLPQASDAPASDLAPLKSAAPVKRPRRTSAVIQALDKSTAETLRFEAPVGQPIRYKDLVFTVRVCEDSAPELGQRGAAANLDIQSAPRPIPGRVTPPPRLVFHGWMFAGAPGLHPLEHPVYDAWLMSCRGAAAP